MFRKILLCVDLYPANHGLLSCAASLKHLGAEEIVLAHIIVSDAPGLEKMLVTQARPEMERQKKVLEDAGFSVTIEMPVGSPAQTLNKLAENHDASIIIIGTHGRGLFESMTLAGSALGNISTKLLHIARRPVLLVRTAKSEAEGIQKQCALFTHILFPTDFSDTSEIALAYLETLVRTIHFPVTLLYIQDRSRAALHHDHRLPELQNLDRNRLQRLKIWLENLGATKVGMELAIGEPGNEIVRLASLKECSLILMGTQGKGITREMLLGSVAHQVARHAEQPVLYIPALPPPSTTH